MLKKTAFAACLLIFLLLAGCRSNVTGRPVSKPQETSEASPSPEDQQPEPSKTPEAVETPTPVATLPVVPKHLAVCVGSEPGSLFVYDALSPAGRSILAAIYDGPFDVLNFNNLPVILEKLPTLENGDSFLQSVEVSVGETIADVAGKLVTLEAGVVYRPADCQDSTCAVVYDGEQPVQIDQWSLRFHILPGIRWSDGQLLDADDSVYAYEVARALYPAALPELVRRTQSYLALDSLTVEWTGWPGYQDADAAAKFFSPLPRHAWGIFPADELRDLEAVTRTPLGWGAYVLAEWTPGDHITLEANPYYFRKEAGLPRIEHLVFRFMSDTEDVLSALLAGECDLLDQDTLQRYSLAELSSLEAQGKIALVKQPRTAWEMIVLGIDSLDEGRAPLFASRELRQAVAMCIDRQAVAEAVFSGEGEAAQSYIPPEHPSFAGSSLGQGYDPQRAADLLERAGWSDADQDPATPRTAQAVPGVADGTRLIVEYLVSDEPERLAAAQVVRTSLTACGFQVEVKAQKFEQYLAAGPEGAVFGRRFDMAQFAWPVSLQPPCFLYLSEEIPGPYPDYPKGWGGANAGGYNSPAYDQACHTAMLTLADVPLYLSSHAQVQQILAEDAPVIPLYWHFKVWATRPDLCGLTLDASVKNSLWNLESLDYGDGCR